MVVEKVVTKIKFKRKRTTGERTDKSRGFYKSRILSNSSLIADLKGCQRVL
uniref:Uncharacterized protein n=1 Tax=Octopus bimaculoides TaxID=37653 RepID=A0A0L8HFJ5_OCTBM